MDRKIKILLIFIMSAKFVFAEEKLITKKISLCGPKLKLYIEQEYELDSYKYVNDEITICAKYFISKENNIIKILYFPRGDLVRIAKESTHYPVIARRIQNENRIAFVIDVKKLMEENKMELATIDFIEIRICDVIFSSNQDVTQIYLTSNELYTMTKIYSDLIVLRKEDYSSYWK